ncbi:hypothetical protein, partial [Treponema paraluiscuniculi]|uniref:hypothetical protein n=1 Tax=Treponema paraluiscuniculi TaxID=53435 RepID=UPI002FDC2EC5
MSGTQESADPYTRTDFLFLQSIRQQVPSIIQTKQQMEQLEPLSQASQSAPLNSGDKPHREVKEARLWTDRCT